MLEPMAKGGMRFGDVPKIRPVDVKDQKITLPDPKSCRESEIVFIPQKIADRLREYIQDKGIKTEQRIFPITYNAARVMVKKAGKLAGVNLRPHDLRRHAATRGSGNQNCHQGHHKACSFVNDTAVFRKGDRRRSD